MDKTNKKLNPERCANEITLFLNTVYKDAPDTRFPVDVKAVALEYSKIKYPSDPIVRVQGARFDDFEGALIKAGGWGILFNTNVSQGRKNFTLAHEFGHYLLHRHLVESGFRCDYATMRSWGSDVAQIEQEANIFASYLLMPFDDFRNQISGQPINLNLLKKLAMRYGTSLTAVILRWLEQTPQRAVFIVSVDGFIDWARSSDRALRTKKFFAARNPSSIPIEIPSDSLAVRNIESPSGEYIKTGGWFRNVSYVEMNMPIQDGTKNYTLLILDDYDNAFPQ